MIACALWTLPAGVSSWLSFCQHHALGHPLELLTCSQKNWPKSKCILRLFCDWSPSQLFAWYLIANQNLILRYLKIKFQLYNHEQWKIKFNVKLSWRCELLSILENEWYQQSSSWSCKESHKCGSGMTYVALSILWGSGHYFEMIPPERFLIKEIFKQKALQMVGLNIVLLGLLLLFFSFIWCYSS